MLWRARRRGSAYCGERARPRTTSAHMSDTRDALLAAALIARSGIPGALCVLSRQSGSGRAKARGAGLDAERSPGADEAGVPARVALRRLLSRRKERDLAHLPAISRTVSELIGTGRAPPHCHGVHRPKAYAATHLVATAAGGCSPQDAPRTRKEGRSTAAGPSCSSTSTNKQTVVRCRIRTQSQNTCRPDQLH